jgi:xylitol oxidase
MAGIPLFHPIASEVAMNKREFLKTSGAMMAGSMFSHLLSGQEAAEPRENWAGNLTYSTDNLFTPASTEELQQVVKRCAKLRALGTRHSFSTIADSTENQVSLKKLDSIDIDDKAHTVTVGAGVKYGQLAPVIDARGYALHNLASLPHISVAGAIATATHGSGIHNGNLATAVSALEFVTSDGQIHTLARNKDQQFPAAVVGLGAAGIVTRVTLNLLPTYQVAQSVYRSLSFDQLKNHFDEIFGAGYSVSLFTDWQDHRATQVWIKRKLAAGDANKWDPEFFGAKLATEDLHPIEGHSAESCTEQKGIPGPWYERLPHFRMNFTPSSGRELQTEYFVPRSHGYEAILAVEELRDKITPHLFVTELRTIAADDLWMSMAYERDSLAIHFTWKPEAAPVRDLLPQIEARLAPFNPRPHWAKLFAIAPAQLQARYPRLQDFKAFLQEQDPKAKFRNQYIQANLYSS